MQNLRLLLIVFIILSSNIVYGQNEKTPNSDIERFLKLSEKSAWSNLDSAVIYANNALSYAKDRQDMTAISEGYKALGQTYRYNNRQDSARQAYREAIEYAQKAEDKAAVARIQSLMAHTYAVESKYKEAIEWYKTAHKYGLTQQDTLILGNTSLDIGVIHARKGEFYIAAEYFYKSIEYYEAIGETKYTVPLLNNIGSIYSDIDEYKKGLIYLLQAKEKLSNNDDAYIIQTYLNIGRAYAGLKQYDKAIENYETALNEAGKINDAYTKGIVYNQLGAINLALGDTKKSLEFYQKAYAVLNDQNYPEKISATLRGLAKANQKLGNKKKALNQIEAANEIATSIDDLEDIVTNLEILSSIHNDLGNSQKAFDYLRQHLILKDSLSVINKTAEIVLLESKYNYKQEELKLTTEVQNLKKDKILQQSRTTILILALVIISLILATLFWFFNRKKQENNLLKKDLENKAIIEQQAKELRVLNNELETKVKERTLELQNANKDLEQANYELRTFNYIASHDIKEPIRVIGGYAGLIFKKLPTDLKESLGEYFDTIKRSTSQLYTLIEDFANYTTLSKNETVETQDVDLIFLVFNVIDNLQETIEKYKGTVEMSNLPTIKTGNSLLFTTLKNLIENGLKYNKSETPTVNINYQKTAITEFSGQAHHQIIVSDNGIGIDKKYHQQIFEMFKRLHNRGAYVGSGIGLAIVKLSVEKLGGTIHLESEEGKGSRFVINLPQ